MTKRVPSLLMYLFAYFAFPTIGYAAEEVPAPNPIGALVIVLIASIILATWAVSYFFRKRDETSSHQPKKQLAQLPSLPAQIRNLRYESCSTYELFLPGQKPFARYRNWRWRRGWHRTRGIPQWPGGRDWRRRRCSLGWSHVISYSRQ